jgi:hypothetical protein
VIDGVFKMNSKIKSHKKKLASKEDNSKMKNFTPRLKIEVVNQGEEKISKLKK